MHRPGALETGMPLDAAVLDWTVPVGMGGKETLHQPAAVNPHERAIVSSGYANDPVTTNHAGIYARSPPSRIFNRFKSIS
jgi:hypothetical protein